MQSHTARHSAADRGHYITNFPRFRACGSLGVTALVLGLCSGGTAWAQSSVITPMLLGPSNSIWRCIVTNVSDRVLTDVAIKLLDFQGKPVFEFVVDIKPKLSFQ